MDRDAEAKQKISDPELPGYMTKGRRSTPAIRGYSAAYTQGMAGFTNSNQSAAPIQSADLARPAQAAARAGSSSRTNSNSQTHSSSKSKSGSGTTAGRSSGSRSGSNGGGNGNSTHRKKKITKSQKLMRFAIAAFGALVLVVGGILLLSKMDTTNALGNTDYTDGKLKFFDGIIIEGIDAGGKTIEEVKADVQRAISARMNEVSIALVRDDQNWSITAADMALSADVDKLLNEAMGYGREGSITENSDIKQELKKENKEFFIAFTVNQDALKERLNVLSSEISKPPVEPHMIPTLTEDIKATFEPVPGQDGETLDIEATAALITTCVQTRDYQAKIKPVVSPVAPSLTMDFVQQNTSFISSFYTDYDRSSSKELVMNRCFNIEKAAARINGCVIQSSEIWSFNGWVGPRTKETGWKEANGISGGKEFTRQYGGGNCQVSTTLYGALLRGNIKIPDGGRKKHSIPSTYVDKGQDATVDTSGIDLFFENDTGAPIYIFAYVKNHPEKSSKLRITVSLYGKPLPEGVTYVPRSVVEEPVPRVNPEYVDDPAIPTGYELTMIEMRPKYKAEVYLDKFIDKKLAESKYLYTDEYRGNEAKIHKGTGDPATVPVPEGAVSIYGVADIPENTGEETSPGQ